MLPDTIALEGMKPIPRGNPKVRTLCGRVDRVQLAEGSADDTRRDLSNGTHTEEFFGRAVGEGLDHTGPQRVT